MSQPQVRQREVDGGLNVLPDQGTPRLLVIGSATAGPLNTPTPFGPTASKLLRDTFGAAGKAVQFAAYAMLQGLAVLFVRAGDAVTGSYNAAVSAVNGSIGAITLNNAGAGTSTFANTTSNPLVGGSWNVTFLVGGTRGTAGIVYQVFKDNVSQGVFSLGTATTFTISSTGITIDISAGTIIAGAFITFATVAPIPASAGSVVDSGGGTSVFTLATIVADTLEPNDDYQPYLYFPTGGTVGTAGIQVQWSVDGGINLSPPTALGTNAFFVFPNSGGIRINFAAGTITTGRTVQWDSVAPCYNGAELTTAIAAAKASLVQWEICHFIGPIDSTIIDVISAAFPDKKHTWYGNTRLPTATETYGDYVTSLAALSAAKSEVNGSLCSGDCWCVSGLEGQAGKFRRPASWGLVVREAASSAETDIADVNLGSLPGISIRDAKGNPKFYDESYHGGLDDLRFHVLRTHDDPTLPGVYSNRPRIFSPAGSDFRLVPHRRIMNIMHVTEKSFMIRRLNKPVSVNSKTGKISKADRKDIASGLSAALRAALLTGKVKVSDISVTVSGDDALLQGAPLTGSYRAVPLAYPEIADFDGGFAQTVNNLQSF